MPTAKKDGRRRLKDWLTLGLRAFKSGLHRGRKLSQTSLAKLLKRRELAMAIRGCAPIRFCRLESRRVLNASFDLIGANLQLSNFANGTNLEVTHNNLGNSYQFTLNSGTWFSNLGVDTGSNVLSVMDSVLTGNLSLSSTVATNILLSGDLGTLNQLTISTLGQVTDTVGTQLQTTSLLSIKSSNTTLGEQATDLYQVGQLSLDTSGSAELRASGNLDVLVAKSSGNIKLLADSLLLRSVDTQGTFDAQATTGDILVGSVSATGDIYLVSSQGSILDAQDDSTVDLTAGGAISLTASQNIQALGVSDTFLEVADGSKVNAKSLVAGDIRLVGLGSMELTQALTADGSITVRSVGTLTALDVDASTTDSIGNDVSLSTLGPTSDLIVHRVVSGINNGQVSLTASRNIVDGDTLVDDLDVIAQTAELQALTGWVGAQAGLNTDIFTESYQANTGLEVRWLNQLSATATVSIVLNPDNGVGSLTLDTPTAVLISNGDVSTANVDYALVSNLALIADADNNSIGIVRLAGITSVSGDLRVQGADVTSVAALDFQAARMFLASGQAERFSVNNLNANSPVELDGKTVGDMTVTTLGSLRLLDLDSNGNSLQSNSGSVLVSSSAGSVTVLASVQSGQNILLHAGEDLTVSAGLQTTSGHISLLADDDITLNSRIATTMGGTVCVEADNQSADAISGILMSNNSSINTTNSDVRMVAANEGSISVQKIDVGQGRVSLIAEGSILAASASHKISASELRLEADAQLLNPSNRLGSVGQPSPTNGSPNNNSLAIHTQVTVIAAVSASGLYLVNDGSVRIDSVSPIVVQCVNVDGSLTQRTDASLADLTSTGNGSIKLQTRGGEIRINDGSQAARFGSNGRGVSSLGSGDILLQATGNNAGVSINSAITAQSGAINIVAALGIQQQSDITVLAPVSSVRSSVMLQSLGGDINMNTTAVTSSNGGNIVYNATGSINLGQLKAGQGSISIDAGASVVDGQNDLVTANIVGFSNQTGQNRVVNIEALSASIRSVDGIGQSRNPLDLSVSFVAADSSENIYLYETDSIAVAAISPIEATQVFLNSTTATGSFGNLAGITSTGGHAKLESIAGELSVTGQVQAVRNVQLAAQDSIRIDANVTSQFGSISLLANNQIQQDANLLIQGSRSPANSILVQSVSNSIVMASSAQSTSNAGSIVYQAATTISIGQIIAPLGAVAIDAVGVVLDSQADTTQLDQLTGFVTQTGAPRTENIVADKLIIRAASIGVLNNSLDINAQSVAVDSFGDIAILETDSVTIGSVSQIQATLNHHDSTSQLITTPGLSGLRSHNGDVRLQSLDGSVVVSNAADVGSVAGQSRGVAASGNVLLAAGGVGNLVIQSSVLSERSDVWLAAGALLASPPSSPASDQTAIVEGDHLTLYAGANVFLPNVLVNSFEAKITAAQNVIPSALFLNQLANQAGTLILNDLQHGPTQTNPNITTPDTPILTTSFQSWIDKFKYTERFVDGYSLLLRNHNPLLAIQQNFDRTLNVQGQAPGVYIETLDPSGAAVVSDLTVAGQVDLASTLVGHDPGIVLIADGNLIIQGSVDLVTPLPAALPKTQSLNTLDLNAKAYNAGEGDPRFLSPQNHNIPATTEYVVDPLRSQTEDYHTHVLQRVLMEFGSAGESGFMSLVHYADNGFQVFQNQGQVSRLTPGSEYQLQAPSNNLQAISNTTAEAALFTRVADFGQIERFFLQNNRDLPTDVVIRRSLDYFLFSNAQSGDASQIMDHASYSQDVLEVKSLGTSSMGPITPIPDSIAPPPPPTRCESPQPEQPLTLILPQVELRQVKSEAIEVAIFQISYDDLNHNGQVENNELPEFDDVLNRVDEDSKLPVESKNAGQSPTQGEIDEVKSKLLDTPDQPSGAYAIIRKNADGKQEVLEVFSVRDWPEGTDPSINEEIMDQTDSSGGTRINEHPVVPETDANSNELPAPANLNGERLNQGASNQSDEHLIHAEKIELVSVVQEVQSTGRWEHNAGVVAALMLLHRLPNSKVQSTAPESTLESSTKSNQSFLRSDRRQRRIRRLIDRLTDSSSQDH